MDPSLTSYSARDAELPHSFSDSELLADAPLAAADNSVDNDDSELKQQADAYAATPQPIAAPPPVVPQAATPSQSSSDTSGLKHQQQEQQLAAGADAAAAAADNGAPVQQHQQQQDDDQEQQELVPLDQLPTFELPATYSHEMETLVQQLAAAAAAAGTMEVLQHSQQAADADAGPSSFHEAMQVDVQQQQQPVNAAHSIGEQMHLDSDGLVAEGVDDISWQIEQLPAASDAGVTEPVQGSVIQVTKQQAVAGTAAAAAAAAGGQSDAAPAPLLLLPRIDEVEAAVLESQLQQQDDEQLQEAAAALGADGSSMGWMMVGQQRQQSQSQAQPQGAAGVGGDGSSGMWLDDHVATAASPQQHVSQLSLQDMSGAAPLPGEAHQQQQQQQMGQESGGQVQSAPQQQQQHHEQIQQHASHQRHQHQQQPHLDLDELLLRPLDAGMDVDAAADIPVLQQPHQQQQRGRADAAYAVLPQPPPRGMSRAAGQGEAARLLGQQDWGLQAEDEEGVGGGQAAAGAQRAVAEGLGPQDFGLPVERPPVFPDEPATLLQMPEDAESGGGGGGGDAFLL